MLDIIVTLLAATLRPAQAYCAGIGANPGFKDAPLVQQVTLTSVKVSWHGLVTRAECADQFIVKSWNRRNPNDYKMSDLLPLNQFSYIVTDLVPNQDYVFQAVAREDKGILGKDWNKSPKAYFRTNKNSPTVAPGLSASSHANPSYRSPGQITQNKKPVSVFMLAGIVIGSLLVLLIVFGGVWNLLKMSRKKSSDNQSDSESETDSMDLDLQNTDLESRIGSRPPSRSTSRVSHARSSRSRRRSPMSVRTGRTLSPQSSIQCSIQEIDRVSRCRENENVTFPLESENESQEYPKHSGIAPYKV
eukprot:TRINITY_DN7958_c0_g1_i1.p1 TRINITY_DN7958_c0_g1~~TRINITY_DN7958_c0_g1_i1.p1  ORF type:complete len:303 (+),score=54.31 TRINITY_DN7958_c0_g1_i1:436-1344(+)